jgi:hypothetical protein
MTKQIEPPKWPPASEGAKWSAPKDPGPAWIAYDGGPAELSDRDRYELALAGLERLWEATGDSAVVGIASTWTSIHHQHMRPWLCSAFTEVLVRSAPNGRVLDHLPPDMQALAEAMLKDLRSRGDDQTPA